MHLDIWKKHELYGPIVRTGPNSVSSNTISGLKGIYGSRTCNVEKSDWYRVIDSSTGDSNTHSLIDRHKHAFQRRVLDNALSDNALKSAEEFIIDNVNIWCSRLAEGASKAGGWSSPKNMGDWATYLGYDIMGNLLFGKQFHCLDSDEHRYVPPLIINATKFVYLIGVSPVAGFMRRLIRTPLMTLFAGQIGLDNEKFTKYAIYQMRERIAAEKDASKHTKKDLAHYLLNARDPQTGKGFTEVQLTSESALLISAGSDTTSISIAAAFFYLLHNPTTLAKLTTTIRSTFTSPDQMNGRALNNVQYLRACIDETIRLVPAVPHHLPRTVLPGGLVIDENYFPPGTIINAGPYVLHHNEEYYPDSFSFRPERWIVDPLVDDDDDDNISSESRVAIARSAFCPFSIGPRGCAGKRVAYSEISYALAHFLLSYDVRLAPGEEWVGGGDPNHACVERRRREEYQVREYFLASRDGPVVQVRARRDVDGEVGK
ncbi:hypothetical protein FQN53_000690 [Emmonsiellopsis sp. PD_33]|nr:hypothetical protein FQN53_000690 [Emmonsiellopsis sp. PD_33]